MRLKDKIALVTGSAGNIGACTAMRFAEEGATVILSDINAEYCTKALKAIQQKGGKTGMMLADMTKEDEIVSLLAKIKEQYGRLDILANIAGGDYEPQVDLDDISDEKMSYNIDVNLKSCIFCCREAAKIMRDQQYGKIINMASIAVRGNLGQFSYSAAKGGVFSFTRTLALSLGIYNINVNAVAPSLVEVDTIKNAVGAEMWAAIKEDQAGNIPLGRVGQPIDVANCFVFLASDEAAFITGQIIEVSGGSRL
jgi:3-oxoacyl-[acyl-carrier protein] reductase